MNGLTTYLAMGGYAAYVWPAWSLTALVMLGLLVATWRSNKARDAELKALQELQPSRRQARNQAQRQQNGVNDS